MSDSDSASVSASPGGAGASGSGSGSASGGPSTDEGSLARASEQALVRRSALGDRDALAELFERHSAATYRYAVTMLNGDEELAQDVVQEAWIKAWRHLPDFRGDCAFRTWLYRITVREVYSARRRRRPIPVDQDRLRRLLETDQEPWSTDLTEEGSGLSDALSVELMGLPWRQRAVWLLREFEDMSYEQIASVLGTNVTTVRGQLHRARRTLSLRMTGWR